ncbi:PREDICTED: chromatin modification-related protein EAF1 B-like isoform X2 [Lupinus angustifolius]|uniref:chromatin modification-related protein EAF1 B-like isoform X2 n=1 Tax=Lupinus angustifolius TaxID=3871 RepID=UPI00092ECED3|nr:PREDICTED: chromatin modification-related protein EAF1 B-like isoform X2 [Lupinus angustifolius]
MLRVVMHGCNSGSALRVNAEFDSMGGVVDGGVGIGLKTSPCRVSIEKAQAELRQEYDVREERRKQLEFLEKGGNPLDFKFGTAASVSVQSTSLTDQHHEQFGTSEAKGSFALTASPHGDSVDSSARPGASFSEPNTADNLLLFDGENELLEGKKRSLHSNKRHNIALPEQCSQIGVSQNAKETEDCATVRPYARRNRSRLNHGPRGGSRDGKGLVSDTSKQKDHNVPPSFKPKPASVNGGILIKGPASDNPLDNDRVGVRAHQTASGSASVHEDKWDITFNRNFKADQRILPSEDDIAQKPVALASGEANAVEERDPGASADIDPLPFIATAQPGKEFSRGLPNGLDNLKLDKKGVPNEGQHSSAALGMKNFDSESSCAQTSLARDVNDDIDMCTNRKNVDENGNTMEQTLESEKKINLTGCEVVKERNKTNCGESGATVDCEHGSGYLDYSGNDNMFKIEEDIHINSSCMQNKVIDSSNEDSTVPKAAKEDSIVVNHSNSVKENKCERNQVPVDGSISEAPQTALAEKVTAAAPDCRPCSTHHLELADKAHEDSILEEAQIIKVKRKRIAELSVCTLLTQTHRSSHWGFVLEEMAWLANDFAQERLWKLTAAAQLCHRASITSRLRVEKQNKLLGRKILSHSMAKAVMQFWHSVELLLNNDDNDCSLIGGSVESGKDNSNDASGDKRRDSDMRRSKYLEGQNHRKNTTLKVHAYALRFLKDSRSRGIPYQAETPTTPNKISDSGTVDMSWEDHLTEENLFYTVPPTSMEAYRKSVESHFLKFEKAGSNIQKEVETTTYDTTAEFGSEEMAYDEDEGEETGAYYLPGVYEGRKSSKSVHKKHKNRMKSYTHNSSEVGTDMAYVHYTSGTHPSVIFGKRPASLNVGAIPTKRIRTASRQRVASPFAVATGTVQAQAKTYASSGDINSFQDDQITLHGSQNQKSVEGESVGDFEKQLLYDCGETSVKMKKPKTMGSAYDQGWQSDSVALNEQRDHPKKKLDNYHFESNGSSGLYGQHNPKKLKTVKQSLDNTSDNIAPITNSIPPPAASQMSNTSNPSKLIRIFSGRDRGRKVKGPKVLLVSSGQPGSGTLWSLFEDQALVVLVHDMGPNWELVSDVINSTLQFKFIYRRPNECKERHKILMDRSVGDGADSAEDSGSSQSYPSTLPGIPKGSAMQLFQRLQGPMEEDTLNSHFDKIIKIGQKQHYHRNQNDNQDSKHLVPIHNSHVIALSQVFPNNLNGGVLTPLDLCDTNATSPDGITTGYQGSHAGGLGLSNHGSLPTVHPTSGPISSIPASSGMSLGINLSLPPAPTAAFIRDSKYGIPRTSSLTVDEQQRIQYNQMISARNMQQSSISVPGSLSGIDRGVHMLPGGSGTSMVGGNNRNIAASRPGFQGVASPSMHGSGGILSSSMVGVPSPVHLHSGVVAGQGNSSPRPREGVHMRTGHNQEHQRQMMVPESQMQATQGNCQGDPAFNNQTIAPHAQRPHQLPQQQSNLGNSRPLLQGLNHVTNSQQQAHAIRVAKERQLRQQQRYRQHQLQQQQLATSNAMVPHVQAQPHLPISSTLQSSSQVKPQNSSQQVSLPTVKSSSPSTSMSSQQQHHLPQHGFSRNPGASGLTTQAVKPQQRPYQQPGRQHLNQPLHAQSQQQANLHKGIGRGNMSVHQNPAVDPSHLNGLSVPPGSQSVETGDQIMHMMQGQNLHHGSGLNQTQPSKPLGPSHSSNHSQLQQKLHSVPANTSSKQLHPAPASHIISPPHPVATDNHHQLQQQSLPQSKQINQTQSNVQRMLQKNCHVHSESSSMPQSGSPQVDQQLVNNASHVSTSTAMSAGCIDSASVVTGVPTVSERPFDSNTPDPVTHVSSLGSAAVGKSAGNELPTISQGLGPQQLSASLHSHAHNSGVQQQPQPLQRQSSSQPILSQQQYQPPEQHKQQQLEQQEQHSPKDVDLQHLQPGRNCLLVRPPSSKAE